MESHVRFAASLLAMLCVAGPMQAQTSTFRLARGFRSPVFATSPPGDDNRLFVVEQTGAIKIMDITTGVVASEPFLTVPRLAMGGERGLLGLAFHPHYAQNGRLYVYASQLGSTQDHQSHVFEYTVMGPPMTSNIVDPDSQRSLLSFDQPFANHNAGWIGFDPTATGDDVNQLYIATGDGGSSGDPRNNSQDITDNPLGKILRIDVSRDDFADDDTRNYSIPPTNPFVGIDGDDEIFAFGLRNPWRNSFDRVTGDLWIGDVGQGMVEEIDFIASDSTGGQNFGWRVMEATRCFDTGDARDGNVACFDPSLTPPVYEYAHEGSEFGGLSVTGGYVYRGPVEAFYGQYFFGDFASGHVWSLDPATGTVLNQNDALDADAGSVNSGISSFAEDNAGNLYILSYSNGAIFRVDEGPIQISQAATTLEKSFFGRVIVEPNAALKQVGGEEPLYVRALTIRPNATLELSPSLQTDPAVGSTVVDQPVLEVGILDASGNLVIVLPESIMMPERGTYTLSTLLTADHVASKFAQTQILGGGPSPIESIGFASFLTTNWVTTEDGEELTLKMYSALAGDVNGDGTVGFDDFLVLSANFGEPGFWSDGDFDDGSVGFSDFLDLASNFGMEATEAMSLAAVVVPEPSARLLYTSATIAMFVLRRRQEA